MFGNESCTIGTCYMDLVEDVLKYRKTLLKLQMEALKRDLHAPRQFKLEESASEKKQNQKIK